MRSGASSSADPVSARGGQVRELGPCRALAEWRVQSAPLTGKVPLLTYLPTLYHPTFLYESLWDLGVAGLLIWAERRYRLGRGRLFALYVAAYTAGRAWIEALFFDPGQPHSGSADQ